MSERMYASAAKLPAQVIHRLREHPYATRPMLAEVAAQCGVHLETVRRAYKGLTHQPPLAPKLDDEWRECVVCQTYFCRRRSGRLMSLRFWARKVTCSQKCLTQLKTEAGHAHPFGQQSTTRFRAVPAAAAPDAHLRQDGAQRLEG